MTSENASYNYFSGIDVGKDILVIAWHHNNEIKSYQNNKQGWRLLWKDAQKQFKNSFVVLETTGWYEKGVLNYLARKGVTIHRASARQVKSFISSFGKIAKTDAIDAKALASYAKERHEALNCYSIIDEEQDQLRLLYERSTELVSMRAKEKNRLSSPDHDKTTSSVKRIINFLNKEIDIIENQISTLINKNPKLLKKMECLQTIEGVGPATAIAILALMPEIGTLNRKQAASLAGLAPHPKDSGKMTGYRKTRGGRPKLKQALHMAALGSMRKKESKLQKFYLHLTEDNAKKPLVALTAVKRKIIVIANARIKEII